MDGVRQLGQIVLAVADIEIIGKMILVRSYRIGPGAGAGDHRRTALCLVGIVGDDGLSWIQLAALEGMEPHGRSEHPVPEYNIPYLKGRKKMRITTFHVGHSHLFVFIV